MPTTNHLILGLVMTGLFFSRKKVPWPSIFSGRGQPVVTMATVVAVTFTVHFARYVATDRTKDAPETICGVDLVRENGAVVDPISVSTRFLPGSFFDRIEYEHLSEVYAIIFDYLFFTFLHHIVYRFH